MAKKVLALSLFPALTSAAGEEVQKPMAPPGEPEIRAPYNPGPFKRFLVSPSAPVRFLFSEKGKQLLRNSPNPEARELLRALGEEVTDQNTMPPLPEEGTARSTIPPLPAPKPRLSTTIGCGSSVGALFNKEPSTFALPQNEQSVDFLPWGAGQFLVVGGSNDYRAFGFTGYYGDRKETDCKPDFEGGLPPVADPLDAGDKLFGGGDPVIAADPVRKVFFAADLRYDPTTTGIGIFRTPMSYLLSTTKCPNGTHTSAQAASCWQTKKVINPLPGTFVSYFQDKPHLAVDERARGIGAGNVYITGTEFDFFGAFSRIWLVACNNFLNQCSVPIIVSGLDTQTQFSHVSVRPDGKITITYVSVPKYGTFDIKYVSCNPATPPATPSCSPPKLVFHETRPIPFGGQLAAQDFRIATYPKHAHRISNGKIETIVVWDRCRVPIIGICPDADIVARFTTNNGSTWSPLKCVACFNQDQFFPWVVADRQKNAFLVAYYTSHGDYYQHRLWVWLTDFKAGSRTPHLHPVTTFPTDPSGDFFLGGLFFGDYIGIAARNGRAYVHYTYNFRQGNYSGILAPQQDNYLKRITYP